MILPFAFFSLHILYSLLLIELLCSLPYQITADILPLGLPLSFLDVKYSLDSN